MKFGKSIRAEALRNSELVFIDFKNLKRLLKQRTLNDSQTNRADIHAANVCGNTNAFHEVLREELRRIDRCYQSELANIEKELQGITAAYQLLFANGGGGNERGCAATAVALVAAGATPSSEHEGLRIVQPTTQNNVLSPSSLAATLSLRHFCISLGRLTAKCKRLRRCVLWNSVAVVKICKKKCKPLCVEGAGEREAASVLQSLNWYSSERLSEVVSITQTMTLTVTQQLTNELPSKEEFRCAICLETVLDPVALRTCGHRFCWACICLTFCHSSDKSLERCPTCRVAFALDPDSFHVDGTLSRFLRTLFPDDFPPDREAEQHEELKLRIEDLIARKFVTPPPANDSLKQPVALLAPSRQRRIAGAKNESSRLGPDDGAAGRFDPILQAMLHHLEAMLLPIFGESESETTGLDGAFKQTFAEHSVADVRSLLPRVAAVAAQREATRVPRSPNGTVATSCGLLRVGATVRQNADLAVGQMLEDDEKNYFFSA